MHFLGANAQPTLRPQYGDRSAQLGLVLARVLMQRKRKRQL
jgi:hypothetical protein